MKTITWLQLYFLQLDSKRVNIFNAKKTLLLLGFIVINFSVFSQFYAGNSFTNKGLTITPGYLFNNNQFLEIEAVINGTDDFVFSKYSISAGKQFIIPGRGDDDKCIKIKTSIGATLSKFATSFMDVNYKEETAAFKLCENVYRTKSINANYKVELIWHNKPFDYFILAGYNKGVYSGIGWRGFLNKRIKY